MMSSRLTYMPALVGLVLILAGYHFMKIELKILGGLYLGWASMSHARNALLLREHFNNHGEIL